jgi:hypothetical protein
MSVQILKKTREQALSCALEVSWQQWAQLGAPTALERRATTTIVDPEALLLLTLGLQEHDRRLLDILGWWAREGSRYTSLQRLTTLAANFPDAVHESLRQFSRRAYDAGDRRFRKLAQDTTDHAPAPARKKGSPLHRLNTPPALMLRLRAGFGLGVKPDLLTVLLGHAGRPLPARSLLAATAYSEPSLRESAHDLVLAGFARSTNERPVRFFADSSSWATVLRTRGAGAGHLSGSGNLATWRFWSPVFAFLAATVERCDALSSRKAEPYPAASSLRDLFEAHRHAFELNTIDIPDASGYEGVAFLEGFAAVVRSLANWVRDSP